MKFNKCGIIICTLILFLISSTAWADTRKTAPTVKKTSTPKAAAAKKPAATQIRPPKIVVETFAYKPAPLKAGNNVDIFITFRNKGLGKSHANAKFKLSCLILSGGGPDKKCPVPNGERTFGKEILPGKTHSVSLLGANPAFAGKYRISVTFPGQKQIGRPFSIILNVAPKFKVQKAPPTTID